MKVYVLTYKKTEGNREHAQNGILGIFASKEGAQKEMKEFIDNLKLYGLTTEAVCDIFAFASYNLDGKHHRFFFHIHENEVKE